MMKEITIERYHELIDKEEKLECLECHGVDNWAGYSEAMEDYYDEAD